MESPLEALRGREEPPGIPGWPFGKYSSKIRPLRIPNQVPDGGQLFWLRHDSVPRPGRAGECVGLRGCCLLTVPLLPASCGQEAEGWMGM